MSDNPKTPDGWRELLNNAIREPELSEEDRKGGRRQRRRARKAARAEQRQRTREAIDEERRREPMTAGGAAVIILAILLIGFGARWLTGGDDDQPAPQATASASPSPTPEATQAAPRPTGAPSPSAEEETDLSDPEQVAREWASAYLTRNPPEDGDHTASVDRASGWMTDALTENLTEHDDPLFATLVSRGGISEVTKVTVRKADSKLGVDTPLRVWRELKITVEVEGYTDYTETHTLQVEITQQAGGAWLVARVLGL